MKTPYNITSLYVSQKNGNDKETGFSPVTGAAKDGPVKTIERALELVRQMRFFGAKQPVTIKVLDSEYTVEKPIVIPNDVYNVTIEPYTKTLISGGLCIKDFKHDTFNGTPCFSVYIPEVAEGKLWFTDFYVDSKHADFTYYPHDGLLEPVEVEDNNPKLHTHSKWFIADKKDLEKIKDFKNFGDCFISYNHYWIDEHTPIESYDIETGKIVCAYKSRFSVSFDYPASAMHYKIENVAETFSNPNEWYLDRETSKVYYIPRTPEQTPENISAYAPVAKHLFILRGTPEKPVENVIIRGFEFAYTTGDYKSTVTTGGDGLTDLSFSEENVYASDPQSVSYAHGSIEMEFAKHCIIEHCSLHSLGTHAIRLCDGCSFIRITDNDIFDIGAGGISVGGSMDKEDTLRLTGYNTISNNVIKSIGRRYYSACGILICHSFGNTVSHNEIYDLFYTGISVGWIWGYAESVSNNNIIEYNHIYNLGQGFLSDMGGIYLLGRQQGTIVRNNMIHDVLSKHYGGWGIYTDEGSSYITIENNICYNLSCNCYHQHYGCMNTARNNIFVQSKEWPIKLSKNEMHLGMVFERNIIISDGTPMYRVGYEAEDSGAVHLISCHDNLIFDRKNADPAVIAIGEHEYNLKNAQAELGLEDGTVIADPLFADLDNHDFTLLPDSPAFKIGFKPIDTKYIGTIR